MKKFTDFVGAVSEAMISNGRKDSQKKNAEKFQSLLEKFSTDSFDSLSEADQTKFIEELKAI